MVHLDWICYATARFMGEMLAVEEIFLVFKLVCCDLEVFLVLPNESKSEHEPLHSSSNARN